MSAGVVPMGGMLDDVAAGTEVKEVTGAVWVVVEVNIVVVAMSGSGVGILAIGVVSGVSRMAQRRESSSGSGVLSESDLGSS